jgi:hypothetical protein
VEIVCNTEATLDENDTKEFDFTALVSSSGELEKVTIVKKQSAVPAKKQKGSPISTKKKK